MTFTGRFQIEYLEIGNAQLVGYVGVNARELSPCETSSNVVIANIVLSTFFKHCMSRVSILTAYLLLLPMLGWTQVDTLYVFYDSDWKEVTSLEKAEYKRSAYQKDGIWHVEDFYKNGRLQMSGAFADKEMERHHGTFQWFYPNGKLKQKADYSNGIQVGEDFLYYENGQLDTYYKFDTHGKLLEQALYREDGSKSVIAEAEFPGGAKNLRKYIKTNLRHSRPPGNGRVLVSFVVDTDGSISDIETVEWSAPAFVYEAIRVVEAMPKWRPAMRDQKTPVRIKYNLPLIFRP